MKSFDKVKTKTVKKVTNVAPAFVVDMTDTDSVRELKFDIILEKSKNGIAISHDDLQFMMRESFDLGIYLNDVAHRFADAFIESQKNKQKKQPWYKRMFNFFKRKK